jgi:hypothetical protein
MWRSMRRRQGYAVLCVSESGPEIVSLVASARKVLHQSEDRRESIYWCFHHPRMHAGMT